jgi:hypothetical protein
MTELYPEDGTDGNEDTMGVNETEGTTIAKGTEAPVIRTTQRHRGTEVFGFLGGSVPRCRF